MIRKDRMDKKIMSAVTKPNPYYPVSQLQCETDLNLETLPLAEEVSFPTWQAEIPESYWKLNSETLTKRIEAARVKLGSEVTVLGHHYQREDIIQFADDIGDSFALAEYAAKRQDSKYIVFCGVHFMAEAADVLSADHQQVILPNIEAGCSMADMAREDDVINAWEELEVFHLFSCFFRTNKRCYTSYLYEFDGKLKGFLWKI